jgi:hypothetical protein
LLPSILSLALFFFIGSSSYGQVAQSVTDVANGMPLPNFVQGTNSSQSSQALPPPIFYTDRPTFQAANPGLPLEDFETGMVLPSGVTPCDEPINDLSNDACFTTGSLLPGFALQTFEGIRPGCPLECPMVIVGAGFVGNPSIVVGPNFFVDTYLITFSPPVTSVGLDLVTTSSSDIFDISITDGTGAVTMTTGSASPAGTFWGVESSDLIASIHIASPSGNTELIDNLEFGTIAPPPPIPTLSEWGLIVLSLSFLIFGIVAIRVWKVKIA